VGYFTEINTLLKLPDDFDIRQLKTGERYSVTKEKERVFPLHIALLLVAKDWDFLGYVVAHSLTTKDMMTTIEFEVLSLFSPKEQAIYKKNFTEAAKLTGEIK